MGKTSEALWLEMVNMSHISHELFTSLRSATCYFDQCMMSGFSRRRAEMIGISSHLSYVVDRVLKVLSDSCTVS